MYNAVPTSDRNVSPGKQVRARPKSMSFSKLPSTGERLRSKKFSGFKSRWTICLECK